MKQQKPFIFQFVHVIFWIIFIGLCIKIGAIAYSFFISTNVNPIAAQNLYEWLNLSSLYELSLGHYSLTVVLYLLVNGLQAFMAYLVIKILSDLDMWSPFTDNINHILKQISKIGLSAWIFAFLGRFYVHQWIEKNQNITIPIEWAYEQILFFAAIITLLSLIFDKGIQLQKENDLTV